MPMRSPRPISRPRTRSPSAAMRSSWPTPSRTAAGAHSQFAIAVANLQMKASESGVHVVNNIDVEASASGLASPAVRANALANIFANTDIIIGSDASVVANAHHSASSTSGARALANLHMNANRGSVNAGGTLNVAALAHSSGQASAHASALGSIVANTSVRLGGVKVTAKCRTGDQLRHQRARHCESEYQCRPWQRERGPRCRGEGDRARCWHVKRRPRRSPMPRPTSSPTTSCGLAAMSSCRPTRQRRDIQEISPQRLPQHECAPFKRECRRQCRGSRPRPSGWPLFGIRQRERPAYSPITMSASARM